MKNEGMTQENHHAPPVFGMCQAPVFPLAREDYIKVMQTHKGDLKTPSSLTHPLHRALLSAQDSIKSLNYENVTLREKISGLTAKELSINRALDEFQMSLEDLKNSHNKARKKQESVDVWMERMEEDFLKDKRALEAQSRQQLEEINSLRKKILVAQTDQGTGRLSAVKDHQREVILIEKENAATKLREAEASWQRRVSQLEEELKKQQDLASSLTNKLKADAESHRTTLTMLSRLKSQLCQSKIEYERKCNALEVSHRKELTAKEESWRQKIRSLEDEIMKLRIDSMWPKVPSQKKKRRKGWMRYLKFRRIMRRGRAKPEDTVLLLAQSKEE